MFRFVLTGKTQFFLNCHGLFKQVCSLGVSAFIQGEQATNVQSSRVKVGFLSGRITSQQAIRLVQKPMCSFVLFHIAKTVGNGQ